MTTQSQSLGWRSSPVTWNLYRLSLGVVAVSTLLVEGAHAAHSHAAAISSAPCATVGHTVTMTFVGGRFTPMALSAKRCDKLVLENRSGTLVELAFGPHEHHLAYPGLSESPLKAGADMTLVLSDSGRFALHDHIRDEAQATLTVLP
jgi:hypothetical protein